MTAPPSISRRDLLRRSGVLAVVAPRPGAAANAAPEEGLDLHLCLTADGDIFAFCGHVDLGTGIRTALAQLVAEELDAPFAAITMVLGDTEHTPNQGSTVASETIQVTSVALRIAAAQARARLLELAAEALSGSLESLVAEQGRVRVRGQESAGLSYAELLGNTRLHLPLAATATLKPVADHAIVGRSLPRTDIPAKAAGRFVYVHDLRLPGMLHGRVVRPPYGGYDVGAFVGRSLEAVDESSIAHLPGIVAVVVEGDFVGVVAEREEQAAAAAACLKVTWEGWASATDPRDIDKAIRAQSGTIRRLVDEGDVDAALAAAPRRLDRTYIWPYQMHASIGPSCAVADVRADGITVWSGSQSPYLLRTDLALLADLPEERVEVIRLEAAGCYGRNCADDVSADALLLSRAVGRPVRVQLTREQEHIWEPKGTGQVLDVAGAVGADGALAAYDFTTRYPSNAAPTLALLLTGRISTHPTIIPFGDRSARPPYRYDNLRVTAHDLPPIVRAAWLRGVSALPNVFAHESFIDEAASEAGADPVEFRLRHLDDPRAAALTRATAARAGWTPRRGPVAPDPDAEVVHGRGFAQARYVHGPWPGSGAAWSAWAVDVSVNRSTGEVSVTRVVVGQDSGMIVNPAGVRHQVHGNVLQSTSRVLKEEVAFTDTRAVANREWGSYPILTFPEVPAIDLLTMGRQQEPPLGVGESASVPSAAAIVNAVYDATGVRFRTLPLTPERVLAGLGRLPRPRPPRKRRWFTLRRGIGVALVAATGLAASTLAIRAPIEAIPRPDAGAYSAATIAHGRALAGLGACAVCHTAPGGAPLAGGLALATPFGTVIATNITPDPDTGIGNWSYPAFERAMREGISRDGRHLYPAFPYPNFARASDADLQALYAFLMAEPAVQQANAPSKLLFPFNFRPLLAGWNLLFNTAAAAPADPARSDSWNRGRYLVDGLGHCGACHSPRNALGAEQDGASYLAGGGVDGWDAPALGPHSSSAIPWSEAALFTYLRTGASSTHGNAAGPMAPVIAALQAVPDTDLRAMATYLAAADEPLPAGNSDRRAAAILASTSTAANPPLTAAARLYDGACAVCHERGRDAIFNAGPALGLSTKLQAARPDNFLRVVLFGTAGHAYSGTAAMPAFGSALDDPQLAGLARYARERFAADRPPWDELETTISRLRR